MHRVCICLVLVWQEEPAIVTRVINIRGDEDIEPPNPRTTLLVCCVISKSIVYLLSHPA
jgi:hypothetical protein